MLEMLMVSSLIPRYRVGSVSLQYNTKKEVESTEIFRQFIRISHNITVLKVFAYATTTVELSGETVMTIYLLFPIPTISAIVILLREAMIE